MLFSQITLKFGISFSNVNKGYQYTILIADNHVKRQAPTHAKNKQNDGGSWKLCNCYEYRLETAISFSFWSNIMQSILFWMFDLHIALRRYRWGQAQKTHFTKSFQINMLGFSWNYRMSWPGPNSHGKSVPATPHINTVNFFGSNYTLQGTTRGIYSKKCQRPRATSIRHWR